MTDLSATHRYIRIPVSADPERDVELWLPRPFTARDFSFLMRYLELMREAMFGDPCPPPGSPGWAEKLGRDAAAASLTDIETAELR